MNITLQDTIQLMLSDDYKERLLAEYWQLNIRYTKLNYWIQKQKFEITDFEATYECGLLESQLYAMKHYIDALERRLALEGLLETIEEQRLDIIKSEKTFGFDVAIQELKKGYKLTRQGWNGKKQYIELAQNISYSTLNNDKINFVRHNDIDSQAIVFVGTSGRQIGWLASQSDMLANDWMIIKEEENE